jgi:hypothetical protein
VLGDDAQGLEPALAAHHATLCCRRSQQPVPNFRVSPKGCSSLL